MPLESYLVLNMTTFMLVFARLGSAVMLIPGVGDSFVSSKIRLLFALAFAVVLSPVVSRFIPEPVPTGVLLATMMIIEVVIGVFIGTVCRIFMVALDTAGMVVSIQSGLANAQVFNPASAVQGSVIGAFFSVTGAVVLFSTPLYGIMLYGIFDSYNMFPMGEMPAVGDLSQVIVRAVSASFMIGVQIAMPIMMVTFLLYVGMGVLARVMPQIQIFILALPVQILLSFFGIVLILSTGIMFWLQKYQDALTFFFSGG